MKFEANKKPQLQFLDYYKRRKADYLRLAKEHTNNAPGTAKLASAAWTVVTLADKNSRYLFGDLSSTGQSYEVLDRASLEAMFVFFIFHRYWAGYRDGTLVFEYDKKGIPISASFDKNGIPKPRDPTRNETNDLEVMVCNKSECEASKKKPPVMYAVRFFLLALLGFVLGALVRFIFSLLM